jgi:hypothetical protein
MAAKDSAIHRDSNRAVVGHNIPPAVKSDRERTLTEPRHHEERRFVRYGRNVPRR